MKSKKATVRGVSFVKELDGISEYTLEKNGLQVLLVPDETSPVVGVMVTYRVGSRNEALGYTGATHLLEHLMFKGSTHFNNGKGNDLTSTMERRGALLNATTSFDRTNYYEVVPKASFGEALALEADRMRNAFIKEEDRVSEMPIVRNEFERGENNPMEALEKQIWALAYQAHPYHHSPIGWKSDFEKVSIERLKQFYNDFYHPDNATVTVVGGFDVEEALALIVKEFGMHAKAPAPFPAMYTEEPKQEGERRVLVKRASATNIVGIAHKVPSATDPDQTALLLLSLILADGKTSRLHRALIDASKAIDVSTNGYQLRDPSLLVTYATLTPKTSHALVENVIRDVYAEIATRGVTAKELSSAKQSIRAYIAARRDGPYAFLSSLNEDIASADWTHFVTFPKALGEVTARQVQHVAKKYLVDDQSTIGYFIGTLI